MALEQHAWLQALRDHPDQLALRGDARGFYDRARDPRPFFSAHIREPLWPYLLRLILTGDEARDAYRVRALTGIINVLLVLVIGWLAWRFGGPLAGGFAAALFSGTELTSYYGISGLREPLMSLLLLIFIGLWTYRLRGPVALAIVIVTALMPLLRLEALFLVPAWLVAVAIWREEKTAGWLALATACVAWAVTFPYLLNCRREFGSMVAPLHQHARYWRNHEFAGRPGHLTREQVLVDAYDGEPVTSWEYIVKHRSPVEIVGRYVTGYWLALTDYVPRLLGKRGWLWLWPVGVGWALWHWRRAGVMVPVGLIAQLPFAFLLPLNMVTEHGLWRGVEVRFAWPLAPFVAIWAGLGFAWLVTLITTSLARRNE